MCHKSLNSWMLYAKINEMSVTKNNIPVVAVVGCIDTVLTVDSVGVVNGVVVTVLSVVTGAVVTLSLIHISEPTRPY